MRAVIAAVTLALGALVTRLQAEPLDKCPFGLERTDCVEDPCNNEPKTCVGNADAECVSNLCGGCHRYFVDPDRNGPSKKILDQDCECLVNEANCKTNPCQVEPVTCEASDSDIVALATCEPNYCDCSRTWYVWRNEVFYDVTELCE